MIVVTGTKRSGTSMWMQVLIGAGFGHIGARFPGKWGSTIRDANPDGFYESIYRRGIYSGHNVDLATGKPLDPKRLERCAVKIFVRGVLRTSPVYLGRVLASMRNVREYESSRRRMWQMEDEARQRGEILSAVPPRLEPAYEWWAENYMLLCDALERRYPFNLCAYDTILEDPERTIHAAIGWLGGGDLKGALAAVRPQNRTQRAKQFALNVEPAIAEVFDELYATIKQQRPLTPSLITKLAETNRALVPLMRADVERVRRERSGQAGSSESHDDGSELAAVEAAVRTAR